MTWPPPNDAPRVQSSPGAAEPPPTFPPAGWPSRSQLDYLRTLIVVVLLLLALPWLVTKLVTNPGAVMSGVGRRVVEKGA